MNILQSNSRIILLYYHQINKVDLYSLISPKVSTKTKSQVITLVNSKSKIAHHAGVGAKAAVFSFNGNKIITTSGGGMLASDDKGLIS